MPAQGHQYQGPTTKPARAYTYSVSTTKYTVLSAPRYRNRIGQLFRN